MKIPPIQTQQDFTFKLVLGLCYFVILLVLFNVARWGIWYTYYPVFQQLTAAELWQGAFKGLLFDTAVICLFGAPLFVLLYLPIRSARYLKILHILWCCLLCFLVFILVADFVYFPEAKRHMAEELLYIKNEVGFLVRYALAGYWWAFLILFATGAGLIKLGFICVDRFYKPTAKPLWKTAAVLLAVIFLLVIGIRGKLGHGKPLSMRSLNSLASNPAQGVLMCNGVFSAYHALRRVETYADNPMPEEQAIARVRQLLRSDKERLTEDTDYPLMRQVTAQQPLLDKNVFIVLLESWTPKYIDAYSHAGYGVTPYFDRLAQEGVQFTNGYASGVRSIFGLTASFAGVPLVPGLSSFSEGLELNHITAVAKVLREQGYYTAFLQTSLRSSYQMCDMATHIFGFEESYGMEDFPKLMAYQAEQDFGYDYDMLQFAAQKAASAARRKQPFFIFTFTGTTHTPFAATTAQFEKYQPDSEEHKYLNTLYYADYAIGQLIESARKEGWLNDTIFIFMADHTMGLTQKDDEIYQKFRIPYVIYAPGILQPAQVAYPVSQLDLIPTLFHLLGLPQPFSALGADALDSQIHHWAFITEGGNIALITPQGFIRHDRVKGVQSSAKPDTPVYQTLEKDVLSLDKSVTSLLHKNRWMRGENE